MEKLETEWKKYPVFHFNLRLCKNQYDTKGIIEMNVYQKIPVDTPSRIGITINYFDGLLGDTINEHGIVIPEIEIK